MEMFVYYYLNQHSFLHLEEVAVDLLVMHPS